MSGDAILRSQLWAFPAADSDRASACPLPGDSVKVTSGRILLAPLSTDEALTNSVPPILRWPAPAWTWPKQWTRGAMRGNSAASAAQPYDRPLLDRSRMSRGGVCVTRMSSPGGICAQVAASAAPVRGKGVRRQVRDPRGAVNGQAAEFDRGVAEVMRVLQGLRVVRQCRLEFAVVVAAGVEDPRELLAAEPRVDAGPAAPASGRTVLHMSPQWISRSPGGRSRSSWRPCVSLITVTQVCMARLLSRSPDFAKRTAGPRHDCWCADPRPALKPCHGHDPPHPRCFRSPAAASPATARTTACPATRASGCRWAATVSSTAATATAASCSPRVRAPATGIEGSASRVATCCHPRRRPGSMITGSGHGPRPAPG